MWEATCATILGILAKHNAGVQSWAAASPKTGIWRPEPVAFGMLASCAGPSATNRNSRWLTRVFVALAVCGVALSTMGSVAHARRSVQPQVSVLSLEFSKAVTEGVREAVARRLERGLAATGLAIMPRGELLRSLGDAPPRCEESGCWRKIWVRVGCRFVAGISVVGEDRSYEIKLWLADTRKGAIVARVAERCDICGLQAVADKVDLAASALRAKLAATVRAPARVAVESDPPRAVIVVDGKPHGHAPRELTLPPGEHQLVVSATGYLPATRTLRAVVGVHERIRVRLIPKPPKSSPLRTAGWVGIGAGAAAVAAGVALFAIDGRGVDCTGERAVPGGQCPKTLSTGAGAWTLTSAGAAAVIAGGYLLYRAYRRHRTERPRRTARADR